MSDERDGAFESYLDKWLEAEPQARLLRLFLPAAREPATAARLVLVHELESAAFGLDPQPAQAKLGWWQEELARWRGGVPRHPITRRLGTPGDDAITKLPAAFAPWLGLDAIARHEQWIGYAAGLSVVVERVLDARDEAAEADPAPVLARLLSHFPRLATDPRGLLPLDVLAEAGATRAELASDPAGAPARRVRAALARRALAAGSPAAATSELGAARAFLARDTLDRLSSGRDPARAVRPRIGAVLGLRRLLRRRRRSG